MRRRWTEKIFEKFFIFSMKNVEREVRRQKSGFRSGIFLILVLS